MKLRTSDEFDRRVNALFSEMRDTVQDERGDMDGIEVIGAISMLAAFYVAHAAMAHNRNLSWARKLFDAMVDKLQDDLCNSNGATVQ